MNNFAHYNVLCNVYSTGLKTIRLLITSESELMIDLESLETSPNNICFCKCQIHDLDELTVYE